VENKTMCQKYESQRNDVRDVINGPPVLGRVRNANLRKGLQQATGHLRVPADTRDFNDAVQEAYLFHGLGAPKLIEKIAVEGVSEKFAGVNAGTMFGDGVYFAEDIGKSDQYCKNLPTDDCNALHARLAQGRKNPHDATEPLAYCFLCRVVLGFPVSAGKKDKSLGPKKLGLTQLMDKTKCCFDTNTCSKDGKMAKELATIPGTATHYHSLIAEVDGSNPAHPIADKSGGTHSEPGSNGLRFREFMVDNTALIYPEYLMAFRRT